MIDDIQVAFDDYIPSKTLRSDLFAADAVLFNK